MTRISRIFILSLAVLLALEALSACGAAEMTPVPGADVPGISVDITDEVCPGIEIKVNDQITWVNQDQSEHLILVSYPDGTKYFESGALQPGDSLSLTFTDAGSFSYTCSADQALSGTISVTP